MPDSAQQLPLMLTEAQIRQHVLPVGRRTLQRYRAAGTFPPPDMRLPGKCFWRRETVLTWLEEHTSELTGAGAR